MPSTIALPNRAVLMDGIDQLDIRSYPLSLPADSDGTPIVPTKHALVRVRVTGICGSDGRLT
jgi:threonine dehydrogenase-like Zn-dependent dehydrogenase